jgi:hypothetical protein
MMISANRSNHQNSIRFICVQNALRRKRNFEIFNGGPIFKGKIAL